MAIVTFALYINIYKIFAIEIKCQISVLEKEGQGQGHGQEENNGKFTIRLHMFEYKYL